MHKYIITLTLLAFAFTASAYKKGDKKKNSKVTPKTELKDTKSFEVGGLKACTVEADEEDAIADFNEALFVEPLTEKLEDSHVVKATKANLLILNPLSESLEDSEAVNDSDDELVLDLQSEEMEDSEIADFE
jgi:hypothetical protein